MQQGAQVYGQVAKQAVSPRELEAQLLIKAAARLQSLREAWPGEENELYEALTFNRKLWTVLATSATQDENPLPQEIKNNIGSLGVFIMGQTLEAQTNPAPEKLNILITINREIAAGLRARAQNAAVIEAQATTGSRTA